MSRSLDPGEADQRRVEGKSVIKDAAGLYRRRSNAHAFRLVNIRHLSR